MRPLSLKPKFQLGQHVYAINESYDHKDVHTNCDLCNSTGIVHIKGKDYRCPECHGFIEKTIINGKYVVENSGKIGCISVEEYLYKKYGCSKICYMLDSTGIGSGTVWPEEKLFPSREEAEEFCKNNVPE
jgi:hypothetical protein